MSLRTIAVIPARYASTRFPGKPLALLKGKPIIQHVWERVSQTGLFDSVLVATDDERINTAVKAFGGTVRMTSSDHPSGTDRIAEVIKDLDCDLVFNVQGDEPFIETEPLTDLLTAFQDNTIQVASLMTPIINPDDITNPNVVKVVTDHALSALYFSRSPIPCNRDNLPGAVYFRHIGVYAYRKAALLQFISLPEGHLERLEKLEQLRLLENGIPLQMVITTYTGKDINTPEDLLNAQLD